MGRSVEVECAGRCLMKRGSVTWKSLSTGGGGEAKRSGRRCAAGLLLLFLLLLCAGSNVRIPMAGGKGSHPECHFAASGLAAIVNFPLWRAAAIGQSGFKDVANKGNFARR